MPCDETPKVNPSAPSGSKLARLPSKAELATVAVIGLGVIAQCSDFLPPKYAGVFILLWAIVRMVLRVTGQGQMVQQAEELSQEIKQDVMVSKAKKPLP